jgi:hypothetical protein
MGKKEPEKAPPGKFYTIEINRGKREERTKERGKTRISKENCRVKAPLRRGVRKKKKSLT